MLQISEGPHTFSNRFFRSSASRVSRKISFRRCSKDNTSSGTMSHLVARGLLLEPRLSQLLSIAAGDMLAAAAASTTTPVATHSLALPWQDDDDSSTRSETKESTTPESVTLSLLRCFRISSTSLSRPPSESLALDCRKASVKAMLSKHHVMTVP
jgi:hypothetical protein